jgi:hypothetical protein
MDDFDSPWKEAIDWHFAAFMAFFFPHAHAEIDWGRGYEFLDKELQQIIKDAEIGRRVVDKLVKVWLTSGAEEWVLIHIEIQTQADANFAERLFVYSYRLFDRYNRKVVSLAVLADDRPEWKPNGFSYAMWGFEIGVRFPIVKLLDYATRTAELARHENPFAIVILAHLKTLETRRNPEDRRASKLALVKSLYERGWDADQVRKLFRFIDWIMDLPDELKKSFWQDFHAYEEEKKMPFITSVERIGIEKGRREALIESIELDVESKFPEQASEIMKCIHAIEDVEKLGAAMRAIKTAKTPDEFRGAFAGKPTS